MRKIGIIGASGYTGGELLRLLWGHPSFNVVWATSRQYAGKVVGEVFPFLGGFTDLEFTEPDMDLLPDGMEAAFVALPHTEAMAVVPGLLEKGIKVVDLSADYRLKDAAVYSEWYGDKHTSPLLLEKAVYGLPELHRERIANAALVANPGCYPTAAILALAPLVGKGLVGEGLIAVDAKSGVSGAGRSAKTGSLFCEVNEGLKPYMAARHRHIPEIEQELAGAAGRPVQLTFTPHLVPLSRGLLETIYLTLASGAEVGDVENAYSEAYGNETFVRVSPPGHLPGIRDAAGTNLCRIGFTSDPRSRCLIVVSAIDNLVKGASGQAVQNLNLMCGIAEETSLDGPGMFP